jgi:hypothetical protein
MSEQQQDDQTQSVMQPRAGGGLTPAQIAVYEIMTGQPCITISAGEPQPLPEPQS